MSTKIAVIADVHGNSAALLAALKEIDRNPEIEHIYCIGDMVGIGYETNEVLDLLFARDDVSFVTGNHEEEILAALEEKETMSHGGEKAHHIWLANRLDKKFIPLLKGLPTEMVVEYEGKKLLFTHYHVDAQKQWIPIDADPSLEKLDSFYKESAYDLVCFGHHHPKHDYASEERIYLNPGALGCYDKPLARYAVISITEEKIDIEFAEAVYSNKEFLAGYEILKVPEKDFILTVFHGNQHLNE